jgi:hypothetical protein
MNLPQSMFSKSLLMMIAWKFNALAILDNMISNKERQKVVINFVGRVS